MNKLIEYISKNYDFHISEVLGKEYINFKDSLFDYDLTYSITKVNSHEHIYSFIITVINKASFDYLIEITARSTYPIFGRDRKCPYLYECNKFSFVKSKTSHQFIFNVFIDKDQLPSTLVVNEYGHKVIRWLSLEICFRVKRNGIILNERIFEEKINF